MRPALARPATVCAATLRPATVRLLTLGLLAPLLALLAVTAPGGAAGASTWAVPTTRTEDAPASTAEFEDQLMVEINKARTANGQARIRVYDRCADRLAERWGTHLARTGLFEHRDQHQVLARCHVTWAGENLVRGTGLTPEAMVEAWLASPGHREIMLNRKAKRAGVSVTRDGQGRLIGVLNVVRAG